MMFERSARSDLRWWVALLVGLAFAIAGWTIDPATNCSADGECAPWLVPIAFVVGIVSAMMGGMQLIINPRSGSCIDTISGELVWWHGLVADGRASDTGRLALAHIARVVLVSNSDDNELFLYDAQRQLLPFPKDEVMPWRHDQWAKALATHVPGLVIEERRR